MNWKPKKAGSPHEARPERNRQAERINREIRALVGATRRGRQGILVALLNDDDGKDVSAPSRGEQPWHVQANAYEAANDLQSVEAGLTDLRVEFAELQANHLRLGLSFAESLETLADRLEALIAPPLRRR